MENLSIVPTMYQSTYFDNHPFMQLPSLDSVSQTFFPYNGDNGAYHHRQFQDTNSFINYGNRIHQNINHGNNRSARREAHIRQFRRYKS